MTLDEISGGRLELGVGAGGGGFDATVLGQPPLTTSRKAARFEEFVEMLDVLLREPAASYSGEFFTAVESRTYPGCTQRPRVPFTVAASGPRSLRVAARFGAAWVTVGAPGSGAISREWFDSSPCRSRTWPWRVSGRVETRPLVRRVALVNLEAAVGTGIGGCLGRLLRAGRGVGVHRCRCPLATADGPLVAGATAEGLRRDLRSTTLTPLPRSRPIIEDAGGFPSLPERNGHRGALVVIMAQDDTKRRGPAVAEQLPAIVHATQLS